MELKLGLALTISNKFDLNSSASYQPKGDFKKRSFDEAFDDDDDSLTTNKVPQTLPLFREDNHMDKSDDDGVVENGVIGWPPIKSCRKKLCHHKSVASRSKTTSLFVKVQVEGVAIARKVDLNLHLSYETLTHNLLAMFDKYQGDYKLTYLDKEGDWLLAGDLPWESFIRCVQRLKLIKKA